jgi:hypothetical protein
MFEKRSWTPALYERGVQEKHLITGDNPNRNAKPHATTPLSLARGTTLTRGRYDTLNRGT